MELPVLGRVIYERPPLVAVHAQLRFPAIFLITSTPPAQFQERIRREYPIYGANEGASAKFPPEVRALLSNLPQNLASVFQVGTATQPHRFESEDRKRRIVLGADTLGFTDSSYVTWEQFQAELSKAERALEAVYEPAFYTRIGLRYQDQFKRSRLELAQVAWQDLLDTHLLGPLADKELADGVLEMSGSVVLGVRQVKGARARVQYGLQTVEGEQCFNLDVDVSTSERTRIDDAANTLNEFSGVARGIFRHVLRDALHEAMGPKPID